MTDHRSDHEETPQNAATPQRVHACLECADLTGSKGEFCSAACRGSFNNRRRLRGAELYDLYMAHRWDRKSAQQLGAMQAINRLASIYREDDRLARAGRRSWRRITDVLEERPYLRSVKIKLRAGR